MKAMNGAASNLTSVSLDFYFLSFKERKIHLFSVIVMQWHKVEIYDISDSLQLMSTIFTHIIIIDNTK